MKAAYSIKLQRIVQAIESDYTDYYGFLLCEECEDLVFLRKSQLWKGKELEAFFVHHKKDKLSIDCAKRVKQINNKNRSLFFKTKNQLIERLALSLWKQLKTNKLLELKNWSYYYKEATQKSAFSGVVSLIDEAFNLYSIEALWECFERTLIEREKYIKQESLTEIELNIHKWLKGVSTKYYGRHINLTWDLLLLFIKNKRFDNLRKRMYAIILHPKVLDSIGVTPFLLGSIREEVELANKKVVVHCMVSFCLIFFSVDWQRILEDS